MHLTCAATHLTCIVSCTTCCFSSGTAVVGSDKAKRIRPIFKMDAFELIARKECESGNEYDGRMGARISAVFVVLVASCFGSFFPLLSLKYSFIRLPGWCFFIAKYFGSGVIVATAFIHLLQPANESLTNECLNKAWQKYPYAFAICLLTLFLLFFFELCAYRFVDQKVEALGAGHSHSHFGDTSKYVKTDDEANVAMNDEKRKSFDTDNQCVSAEELKYPTHFSHADEHQDRELLGTPAQLEDKEQYYGQLMLIFVLEFGVVFHSVFVGLSLAVAGDEFKTLYVVIVFHQLFEGLGLGTRLSTTQWPAGKHWTPWLMALAYGLTTPIAIAIGLGVRHSYPPESQRALIVNGVFDSISAGILLYTGLIELMAHEFLYSTEFKGPDGGKRMIYAYIVMCFGTGLMALLGRWA